VPRLHSWICIGHAGKCWQRVTDCCPCWWVGLSTQYSQCTALHFVACHLCLLVRGWFPVVHPGCCTPAPLHMLSWPVNTLLAVLQSVLGRPKAEDGAEGGRHPGAFLQHCLDTTLVNPGAPWQNPLAQCCGLNMFGRGRSVVAAFSTAGTLRSCGCQLLLCEVMLRDYVA
jgi:hypothetical protein